MFSLWLAHSYNELILFVVEFLRICRDSLVAKHAGCTQGGLLNGLYLMGSHLLASNLLASHRLLLDRDFLPLMSVVV